MAMLVERNLTAVTWAHGVNSKNQLNEALNSNINMIETDIVLGKLNNTGDILPIIAHPPAITSDITLEELLNEIKDYNQAHEVTSKGVKLDFKSIEVFEGSLEILKKILPQIPNPIWLNADIIRGPVNNTDTLPVDPHRFLGNCVAFFNQAVLSIGWTTEWGPNYNDDNNSGAYSATEIKNMLDAIKENNITKTGQSITFPVRAGIAANSLTQLNDLISALNDTNDSTLTIWSSQNDYVNIEKLRELILGIGYHKVYLDVPDEISSQLNLPKIQ